MSKIPFLFLFLIPIILVPCIYIDYEKSHSYCIMDYPIKEVMCGTYQKVLEYAQSYECVYFRDVLPSAPLCIITNSHNGYEETFPKNLLKVIPNGS